MGMNQRLLRPRATVFGPKSIAGLYAWYDFSDTSTLTLNGSTISQIADKAGGRNLSQAVAATQPTRTTSALNGRTAATFSGTQWLQAATAADWKFLHYGSDKSMVFAVIKGTGHPSATCEVFGTTHSPFATGMQGYWLNGDLLVGAATCTSTGNANFAETAPTDMEAPLVMCAIGDPSASGVNRLLMAWHGDRNAGNMSYQGFDNSPQDAAPTNAFTVGRSGTGAAPYYTPFEGLICDVLIYSRSTAFTSAERDAVFSYLVAKWAIT